MNPISPSPPSGAERVGVRWGLPLLQTTVTQPTSPSPSLKAMGPLPLPPQAGGEGKFLNKAGCSRT
jgi:hypothetical protein